MVTRYPGTIVLEFEWQARAVCVRQGMHTCYSHTPEQGAGLPRNRSAQSEAGCSSLPASFRRASCREALLRSSSADAGTGADRTLLNTCAQPGCPQAQTPDKLPLSP